MTKTSSKQRIMDRIVKHSGVTSIGLVASDLNLSCETVKKHVKILMADGVIEYGWDGQALTLTIEEQRRRQQIDPMGALIMRLKAMR